MVLTLAKEFFNKIFKEETKEKLRKKFIRVFVCIDKRIVYKEYLKACKYILHEKIYGQKKTGYEYRTDKALKKIKEEYLYSKITSEADTGRLHVDKEMSGCLERVRKNGFDMYCGSLENVSVYSEKDIKYDAENDLFYGIYEGKKLYFSEFFHTVKDALEYMNEIAAEQSEHSPHKYLAGDFDVDREDVVFDIGCAEGNLSLSIVDRVKKIYLFEADAAWMKPLQLTFAPYMDKVHIVRKFVSKNNDSRTISIDSFCKENNIKQVGFIKMDVEGAEQDVLLGAKKMLRHGRIHKMAICTYHKVHDEKIFREMLPDYRKVMSEGYMLHTVQSHDFWNMELPYFTRGVMRATLKEDNIQHRKGE